MEETRKFKVFLTPEQRHRLEALTRNGHAAAKKILRARILLMADEEHPEGRWHDEQLGFRAEDCRGTRRPGGGEAGEIDTGKIASVA